MRISMITLASRRRLAAAQALPEKTIDSLKIWATTPHLSGPSDGAIAVVADADVVAEDAGTVPDAGTARAELASPGAALTPEQKALAEAMTSIWENHTP